MKLPKWAKILVGILTFMPFVIMIGAFCIALIQIISEAISEEPVNIFAYLAYLQYLVPIFTGYTVFYLTFGLFYLAHMILNPYIDTEKRLLWIAVLFFLNALCLPFYWYSHIWKEPLKNKSESGLDYNLEL